MAAPVIDFPDPTVEDHVLRQSLPFVSTYRVLSHASLLLRSLRVERESRRPVALAVGCIAADLGSTALLAGSKPERLLLRIAYDALDAAIWAASAHGDPIVTEGSNLLTVGTSVEAGYRAGRHPGPLAASDLRCLLPTAVTALAAARGRRRVGGPPGYGFAAWGLIAAAVGFALGRNQRAAERRLVESWREHAGPKVEAAWWLGQHDLATDERSERSPHHLTKELLLMERDHGSARARNVRSSLEGRKQEVHDLTRQFGDYLGRVVLGRAVTPAGAWSVRLTPEQVRLLERQLPPRGDGTEVVEVLNEVEARRPGGEVELRCGDQHIVLAAAAAPERWRGDAAAVGFLFGAMSKFYPAVPDTGGAPIAVVALPALIDVMGAYSYRRDGPSPDPGAPGAADQAGAPLQAALVSGLLLAIGAGATARTFSKGEVQVYPGGEGLWGFHIVLARYYAHLSTRQRAWALVGSACIASVAATLRWIRTGEGLHAPSAIEAALAALVPFTASLGLGERLLDQASTADRAMSSASKDAMDAARVAGAQAEARRLASWMDDAELALADMPDMPEAEAARLRSRFGEVREWLINRT